MIVVGIDYSMSSPAICVHTGTKWTVDNCQFHFITGKKKCQISDRVFKSYTHIDYLCSEQRYDNISAWALSVIPNDAKVFIEGYSYGSKGQISHICENGGLLRHKLWKRFCRAQCYTTFAPPTIKKFATGKGNATKELMHDSFVRDTAIQIDRHFNTKPGSNPISDIVDAYYIAQLGFTTLTNPMQ